MFYMYNVARPTVNGHPAIFSPLPTSHVSVVITMPAVFQTICISATMVMHLKEPITFPVYQYITKYMCPMFTQRYSRSAIIKVCFKFSSIFIWDNASEKKLCTLDDMQIFNPVICQS